MTECRRVEVRPGVRSHEPPGLGDGGGPQEDPTTLSKAVVDAASALGFVRAGVASLEAFDEPVERLRRFIDSGRAGRMDYLDVRDEHGELVRKEPRSLMPEARSAIVVALPYAQVTPTKVPGSGSGVAAYARGRDYHLVIKELLGDLADRLAVTAGQTVMARACVDSAPLLERDLAVRAGIAFLGKNTLAISPGAGSHFLLGVLLVDVQLAESTGRVPIGCGSCTACLKACPTNAFVDAFQLDATRCISYLTIESSEDIPEGLRAGIGGHLFGCDDCQSVCPYNASGKPRSPFQALEPKPAIEELTPERALEWGSAAYKRTVQGTALRRASRNQLARNAAIVLGNGGQPSSVEPLLMAAQTHLSLQVRRHSVWALAELFHTHGLHEAREALCSLENSESEVVRADAQLWLDSEAFEKARSSHPAADAHGDEGVAASDPS